MGQAATSLRERTRTADASGDVPSTQPSATMTDATSFVGGRGHVLPALSRGQRLFSWRCSFLHALHHLLVESVCLSGMHGVGGYHVFG